MGRKTPRLDNTFMGTVSFTHPPNLVYPPLADFRSFFQSVCVIGYCLFPLVLVSVVSIVVPSIYIRLPLCGVAFAWASWASLGFLSDSNLANRRALGVYPLFLFYFIIGWMILIS